MRLLVLALCALAINVQAAEKDYTCSLSTITDLEDADPEEPYTVTGTLNLSAKDDKYLLKANGVIKMTDEETPIHLEDLSTLTVYNSTSQQSLEEISTSDNVGKILLKRLGDEKAIEFRMYKGQQASDDGLGLVLYSVIGEKGTVRSILTLGWMPAYCD